MQPETETETQGGQPQTFDIYREQLPQGIRQHDGNEEYATDPQIHGFDPRIEPTIPKHASWHLMSGRAKNNWIKKQKYKLLRIGLVEAGREARGEGEQVRD